MISIVRTQEPLLFEVISAHICENDDIKRYVVYTLQVCHVSRRDGTTPIPIERRYTQFLNLYNGLMEEYPELMSGISFPKKALIGNFDNKLIGTRTIAFEGLLKYVMTEEKLRTSKSLLIFLQESELVTAKRMIALEEWVGAIPILENTFTLLNNIYTDRSPQVLLVLCRLLVCSFEATYNVLKWADLALHRFDGVSDSDLLLLYIPLLHLCKKIWALNRRDQSGIDQRLEDLKRQGIGCTDNVSLMDAILKVELILTGTPT